MLILIKQLIVSESGVLLVTQIIFLTMEAEVGYFGGNLNWAQKTTLRRSLLKVIQQQILKKINRRILKRTFI